MADQPLFRQWLDPEERYSNESKFSIAITDNGSGWPMGIIEVIPEYFKNEEGEYEPGYKARVVNCELPGTPFKFCVDCEVARSLSQAKYRADTVLAELHHEPDIGD